MGACKLVLMLVLVLVIVIGGELEREQDQDQEQDGEIRPLIADFRPWFRALRPPFGTPLQ